MNRKQGIAKLKQIYGSRAAYREDAGALTGEARAVVLAEVPKLRAEAERLAELRKARREAVLAADPEYQALLVSSRIAQEIYENARPALYRHRVTVGYSNGVGFHISGSGDNWQEAIDAVCAKTAITHEA